MRETLMIPGPVTLAEEVTAALVQPVRPHYGREWVNDLKAVTSDLAEIFRTEGTVLPLFGPGSAGIEMALGSTLSRGDEIAIPSNGAFADRMQEMAEALGFTVHKLRIPDGARMDVGAVASLLDSRPNTRALGLVHHETIVGILNPIQDLASLARHREVLTVVDAVSSLGGVALDTDGWGIDVCVGVANKCLGGPVGIAPVAVGPRAWAAVNNGRPKAAGWYLNFQTWLRYQDMWADWHPHPTTMPTMVMAALGVAVRRILDEGLPVYLRRQAEASRIVRHGLRELGFDLLAADDIASPVVTAAWLLPEMDVDDFTQWLHREHGIRIGGGTGALAGRMIRVSHMATAADPHLVDAFLEATRSYISRHRLRAT